MSVVSSILTQAKQFVCFHPTAKQKAPNGANVLTVEMGRIELPSELGCEGESTCVGHPLI